jgi:hypothetical protein
MLSLFALCTVLYVVSALALHNSKSVDVQIRYVLHCFTIAIYLILAHGYLVYGALILRKLRVTFSLSVRARRVLMRVGVLATLCFVCFTTRSGVVIWQLTAAMNLSETKNLWFLDFVYYFMTELLPLAIMVALLAVVPEFKSKSHGASTPSTPLFGNRASREVTINAYSAVAKPT